MKTQTDPAAHGSQAPTSSSVVETSKGPIAYIAHYFPTLTQTFVYHEILALEEAGWKVLPFSIRRPTKAFSDQAAKLASRTFYLIPILWMNFLWWQVALFLEHPVRYLKIFACLITRPGESLRSRLHGLTHFFGGMYLVPELRRAGVKHFHAHFGQNPTTLAMTAAEYLGIPFSMTIHARDLFVDTALLPAKLERAKFVVTISEYNRRLLRELAYSTAAAEKIRVLHCGIDIHAFEERQHAKEEAPSTRAPVFFAVGRLVEKKGYVYLVEAAKILKERGVPFEVKVIGGGPDETLLAARVSELGVEDCVRLEGSMPQEDLLPLLKQADAFVLPCVLAKDGDQDGIPVSLMEAMAYGVPCVSTGVSGVPELIEDGKEGLLVPQKDGLALANALEKLARDPELRRKLGKAGRLKVEREFTLQGLAGKLDELFSDSL